MRELSVVLSKCRLKIRVIIDLEVSYAIERRRERK